MSATDTNRPPKDLAEYLDWLEQVWLPSLGGKPPPPSLTLIRGGRDAE